MATPTGAFVAGGIAACGAVIMTHPFETVKIRMQLQGELLSKDFQPRLYKGPFHGIKVIVCKEGIRSLYSGIGGAFLYQMILNGCRLSYYEPIRQRLSTALYSNPEVQSLPVNIFSGSLSGAMGAAAGSPFFLIKTRLQSFSPIAPVGTQHKYKNTIDAIGKIYSAEGILGLYRGVSAALIRTSFGSSVQLPTYFLAKSRLEKNLGFVEGPTLHLVSSTISGFTVCCVMHPTDTILSRMYNQNGNLYRGVIDCIMKTVKTEGVLATYKGFLPHLARIMPHTVLTLSLAEQTNKIMRKFEIKFL